MKVHRDRSYHVFAVGLSEKIGNRGQEGRETCYGVRKSAFEDATTFGRV